MSIASDRLEETLETWEDLCLAHEIEASLYHANWRGIASHLSKRPSVAGAWRHWRTFRQQLLDNRHAELPDPQRWLIPRPIDPIEGAALLKLEPFPFELFGWTRTSRRVFAIEPGLQSLFTSGTYPGMRWQHLTFPFPSFMVELENPIRIQLTTETLECDCFQVSRTHFYSPEEEDLRIRFFLKPDQGHQQWCYTASERQYLLQALARKQWEKLLRRYTRIEKRKERYSIQGKFNYSIVLDNPRGLVPTSPEEIFDTLQKTHGDSWWEEESPDLSVNTITSRLGYIAQAMKIVAGLCLYLDHFGGNGDITQWKKPPQHSRPGPLNVIMDTAHVCRVLGHGSFNPTRVIKKIEREGSPTEKSPHWRRAHWRRPAGEGNNPKAPRSIFVPSALIRKDRLPEFGIPGGTTTIVKVP